MQAYSKEFLMKVLEKMMTIRKFEQTAADSFLKGQINGNVHVCLGEEGSVVGANMALEPTDYISASHRGHGHCIMKSGDVNRTMAELFGKETGFCKGRGGSMHVTKVDSGLLGANGIVGGGIPLATGSALASKLNHDNSVPVAFFGDGSTSQGCFHECLNMAATWKLPVIFFIENNGFAVSTRINTVINTATLAARAQAYDIPGVVVDGTDVLAVYEAVKEAAARARNGEGPTLIESKMYRFTGHFIGDPAAYMSDEYKTEAESKDPIEKYIAKLLSEGIASQEEIDTLDQKTKEIIEKAHEFALNSPMPESKDVLLYNYSCENERSTIR